MRRAGDLWNALRFLEPASSGGLYRAYESVVSFPLLEGAPMLGEGQPERGLILLGNVGSQHVAS